jgi:hypothetical protein
MRRGDLAMVDACRQFGISLKTDYKILHRRRMHHPSGPPHVGARATRTMIGAQQNGFTSFQAIENQEQPHEALGMQSPAELYGFSPRQMPAKLAEHEYASDMELRRVRTYG